MVLFGKRFLCLGRAVGILEPFDVAGKNRREPDALNESVEIHDDARLIAVGVRDDDSGAIGVHLEQRPDGRVELRVHQDEMFSMADRVHRHVRTEFHLSGRLDHDIDLRAFRERGGVVGDRRPAGLDGLVQR